MVREIVRDTEILQTKSKVADVNSEETERIIRDLIDTANANMESNHCVGLAAIQIGEPSRIIVVYDGKKFVAFVNPIILKRSGKKYIAIEGCLSLEGEREVERRSNIELAILTKKGITKEKFSGFMAQIIQHEVDHLNGKLI